MITAGLRENWIRQGKDCRNIEERLQALVSKSNRELMQKAAELEECRAQVQYQAENTRLCLERCFLFCFCI